MTNSEDIVRYCGYQSVSDFIDKYITESELLDIIYSSKEATLLLDELIEEVASAEYDWYDEEQAKADVDDRKYDEYKDREFD